MLANRFLSRFLQRSDVNRWSGTDNLNRSWDARTQAIAGLVPPGARVLEFGAGRRLLEKYLPDGCTYLPSDIVARGGDTFVCDLNVRPLPSLQELAPDVAVFSGVLEYIEDLPSLVAWLGREVETCIASYQCLRSRPRTLRRVRERFQRARGGWLNDYAEDELLGLFRQAGFVPRHETRWRKQDIWTFQRSGGDGR